MPLTDLKLQGKKIAVTGASGFLGKHICNILKENYVRIIPIDIFGKNDINKVDISDIEQLREFSKQIYSYGRVDGYLDGLINNAAVSFKGEHITTKEFAKTIEVNIQGTNNCISAFEDLFSPNASIVNIASVYGVITPDFSIYDNDSELYSSAAYGASKAAVIQLTKYHAKRLAPVRVNSVSPGGIFDDHSKEFVDKYSSRVPIKRMADPQEIVNAMVFLLSDMSSYITGHNLIVDGGLTI